MPTFTSLANAGIFLIAFHSDKGLMPSYSCNKFKKWSVIYSRPTLNWNLTRSVYLHMSLLVAFFATIYSMLIRYIGSLPVEFN